MRLSAATSSALSQNVPLVVLLVTAGRLRDLPGGRLGERAAKAAASKAFTGEQGSSFLLVAEAAGGPRAMLLLGMGKAGEAKAIDFCRAGAVAGRRAAEIGARNVVVGTGGKLAFDARLLRAFGEGAMQSAYRYPRRPAKTQPPTRVQIVSGVRGAAAILKTAQGVGDAVNLARELGDLPGNIATPTYLKNQAAKLCRAGKLRFRAHDKKALQRMKMGGILAVNQGSAEKPWMFEMEYRPAKPKRTVCIVGKGLTFDSGGISIKPSAHMEEMKYDMCGAAATIGAMAAIAATRPKDTRVIGIVGSTDNMSGSNAYKPGDVIRTGSGSTIEVINTDAEGRVVLADALHHAKRFKPDAIIDLATLTGAIVVALGHEAAGLFTRDDALRDVLLGAADRAGEQLWPMPTYDSYSEAVKSRWADVRNSTGREGGSCTAAAFLFHFTEGFTHAHIDIAGTAWGGKPLDAGAANGASGYGVRLLHEAVTNWRR